MKLLVVLAAVVVAAAALSRDSEMFSQFPDSWYEEEAEKASQDPEFNELPHFITADEDLSADFGASRWEDPKNALQVAQQNGASIFVKAAYLTKTSDTFANTQNITIFVPSNAAFARMPKPLYFYFLRHPDRLGALLKFHAAQGSYMIKDLVNDQTYNTLQRNWTLRYDAYNHTQANYTSHIIQTAQISHRQRDLAASNGVVHIIDEVILALPLISAYDVISRCPDFSTLYNGLIVAGLTDALKSAGPLTLFAPNERAFKRLPAGVWENLLKNPAQLTQVLNMHVSNRTYFARGFRDMDVIPTLNAANSLTVHIRRDREEGSEVAARGPAPRGIEVQVNDAKIIYFDATTNNGDIHAIDTVLIPASIKKEYNLM